MRPAVYRGWLRYSHRYPPNTQRLEFLMAQLLVLVSNQSQLPGAPARTVQDFAPWLQVMDGDGAGEAETVEKESRKERLRRLSEESRERLRDAL